MLVDPKDGVCRSCGGWLEITDFDNCSMTVYCRACGDSYPVETDASGDGGIDYYTGFLAERMRKRDKQ
jgi:hypothetical protein